MLSYIRVFKLCAEEASDPFGLLQKHNWFLLELNGVPYNFPLKGLFFGLAFLAGTFTSMAVFSGYTIMGQNHLAATLFGFTDIVQVANCVNNSCFNSCPSST